MHTSVMNLFRTGIVAALAFSMVLLCGCDSGSDLIGPAPAITIAALQRAMEDDPTLTVADVRTAEEYAAAHIPGSRSLPLATLDSWAATLDKSAFICCVCACTATDGIARTAANRLLALGFTSVFVLEESLALWPGILPSSTVSVAGLRQMMADGQDLKIIDVRTPAEYAEDHIPGSINLPLDSIDTWMHQLDPRERVCCICGTGGRSWTATTTLIANGFRHVYNVEGGMVAWNTCHYCVRTVTGACACTPT